MVLKVRGRKVHTDDNHLMAKQDVKAAFGTKIRSLRTERGWSQERLAERVDLDRSYVGGVERGERNISLENIAKFAEVFETSLAELMEFECG